MKTDSEVLHHIVGVCWNCAELVSKCANYCIGKPGMAECMRLCNDCFEICMQCVKECEQNHSVKIKSLKDCVAACEACADECNKHNNISICRKCAEACRICADECRKDA